MDNELQPESGTTLEELQAMLQQLQLTFNSEKENLEDIQKKYQEAQLELQYMQQERDQLKAEIAPEASWEGPEALINNAEATAADTTEENQELSVQAEATVAEAEEPTPENQPEAVPAPEAEEPEPAGEASQTENALNGIIARIENLETLDETEKNKTEALRQKLDHAPPQPVQQLKEELEAEKKKVVTIQHKLDSVQSQLLALHSLKEEFTAKQRILEDFLQKNENTASQLLALQHLKEEFLMERKEIVALQQKFENMDTQLLALQYLKEEFSAETKKMVALQQKFKNLETQLLALQYLKNEFTSETQKMVLLQQKQDSIDPMILEIKHLKELIISDKKKVEVLYEKNEDHSAEMLALQQKYSRLMAGLLELKQESDKAEERRSQQAETRSIITTQAIEENEPQRTAAPRPHEKEEPKTGGLPFTALKEEHLTPEQENKLKRAASISLGNIIGSLSATRHRKEDDDNDNNDTEDHDGDNHVFGGFFKKRKGHESLLEILEAEFSPSEPLHGHPKAPSLVKIQTAIPDSVSQNNTLEIQPVAPDSVQDNDANPDVSPEQNTELPVADNLLETQGKELPQKEETNNPQVKEPTPVSDLNPSVEIQKSEEWLKSEKTEPNVSETSEPRKATPSIPKEWSDSMSAKASEVRNYTSKLFTSYEVRKKPKRSK
ncbi:hypothetical protein WDW89_21410 [Deltaproteobacteria bacterium TL4]